MTRSFRFEVRGRYIHFCLTTHWGALGQELGAQTNFGASGESGSMMKQAFSKRCRAAIHRFF